MHLHECPKKAPHNRKIFPRSCQCLIPADRCDSTWKSEVYGGIHLSDSWHSHMSVRLWVRRKATECNPAVYWAVFGCEDWDHFGHRAGAIVLHAKDKIVDRPRHNPNPRKGRHGHGSSAMTDTSAALCRLGRESARVSPVIFGAAACPSLMATRHRGWLPLWWFPSSAATSMDANYLDATSQTNMMTPSRS
jgi:hypothetical protein